MSQSPNRQSFVAAASNRRLNHLLLWDALAHPLTPVPPWRTGAAADQERVEHFAELVAEWGSKGKLSCECCGERDESVGYTGHVRNAAVLCALCAFGVECQRGVCADAPRMGERRAPARRPRFRR